jgi:uncharacterized repeat protein (TIGR03803 family)
MKSVCTGFFAGVVGCALALPIPAAEAAAKLKVLHSFGNGTDGAELHAALLDVKGTLYGTTYTGGANGAGTVFSLNPKTGAEKILYSFQNNGADGQNPKAGLIDVQGTLYGTTFVGGADGSGTVFALDPKTGAERVVYSFQNNGSDGQNPYAALIDVNGTLYGTTEYGGTVNFGTLFAINPATGAETVLHIFGGIGDGRAPTASLISVSGTFYGTTLSGGASGGGTVFAFDQTTGVETIIYSFCSQESCTDGAGPYAGLIDVNGTLYGTASNGGANCTDIGGCGVAFAVDATNGTETVLHSFGAGTDGTFPLASLIDVKGELYGTTPEGGGANCTNGGCGTVFGLNVKTGAEKVLYSFCGKTNCTDGGDPDANLIDVNGALYGTTYTGGAYGYGTAFAIPKP